MGARGEADLLRHAEHRLSWAGALANLLGATDLFLFGALLIPVASADTDRVQAIFANAALFIPYMALTLFVGRKFGRRHTGRLRGWLSEERPPTPEERDDALRVPLVQARITLCFWVLSAIVFGLFNALVAPGVAAYVPLLILLGAGTTATVNYLLAERIMRPITARALAGGLPDRPAGPGVAGRVLIVWAAATGVPLLGIAATALGGLLSDDLDGRLLAAGVLFLAVVGATVSLVSTSISARSLAEPLAAVRGALERVEQGDFDTQVTVDNGSELGLVEAGFNRMAEGLRERERVRDIFGRHVGRDVARAALAGDVELGGEVREVGALFVDVIGSTVLATRLPPQRVVALLNDFFKLVVEVTEAHGGLVNKFEGDGAVCVFGAPAPLADPAGSALAAARELRARLLDELPRVDAAIGVSAGEAVAGNVGAEERFEYTVIGDPVNEAARLCEVGKGRPERLVASDAAVRRAGPAEASRWALGEPTVLRGRDEPTRVATVS